MNARRKDTARTATVALLVLLALEPAAGVLAQEPRARPMRIPVSEYTDRPPVNERTIAEGRRIYRAACEYCHGPEARGQGPVAFFLSRDLGPHPRDFTSGVYKFRSTYSGDLPTDEDIFRTITRGVPGFMPPFAGMDPADRWKVIYYIKTLFAEFGEFEPELVEIVGAPIPASAKSVARGHQVYQELKCWECHGGGGKGNGEKARDLKDDWGFRLPPADLTRPSSFKNGHRPEDIYRTIVTGLDGGAMTSFVDVMQGREEDIWHLVNFILSLSEEDR